MVSYSHSCRTSHTGRNGDRTSRTAGWGCCNGRTLVLHNPHRVQAAASRVVHIGRTARRKGTSHQGCHNHCHARSSCRRVDRPLAARPVVRSGAPLGVGREAGAVAVRPGDLPDGRSNDCARTGRTCRMDIRSDCKRCWVDRSRMADFATLPVVHGRSEKFISSVWIVTVVIVVGRYSRPIVVRIVSLPIPAILVFIVVVIVFASLPPP